MVVIVVNELPNIASRVRYLSSDENAAQEIEQIAQRFADVFGRVPTMIYRCGLVVAVPLEDGDKEKIECLPLLMLTRYTSAVLWYNVSMNKYGGRFQKGEHRSPGTEFKPGEHWRKPKPMWKKEWLFNQYVNLKKSCSEIAKDQGVTESAVFHWLIKHGIERRSMSDARKIKHWGLSGEKNGMYGVTGENNPRWRGGCTPDRQQFYTSREWANACSAVWKRDNAKCVRCGSEAEHVHHIVSFSVKRLRADVDNLVLLCARCHHWVHSKKNTEEEFIRKEV